MEALLRQIIQLSSDTLDQIDDGSTESFTLYMEQRNKLFMELEQFEPTKEQRNQYRSLIASIQAQDKVIMKRMIELREQANIELCKLKAGKKSKSMYESSYRGEDGIFFDTKR